MSIDENVEKSVTEANNSSQPMYCTFDMDTPPRADGNDFFFILFTVKITFLQY